MQFIILKKRNPKKRQFEGISVEFLQKVLQKYSNIILLGINEPSFDPEEDHGAMLAHKFVFNCYKNVYLVELLSLDNVDCGDYYCLLNLFRYSSLSDAYPCSPVLYKIPAFPIMVLSDSCLFCKIIRGAIPSFKVYENNLTYAFLDINPLSEGHIVNALRMIKNCVFLCFLVGDSKVPWCTFA